MSKLPMLKFTCPNCSAQYRWDQELPIKLKCSDCIYEFAPIEYINKYNYYVRKPNDKGEDPLLLASFHTYSPLSLLSQGDLIYSDAFKNWGDVPFKTPVRISSISHIIYEVRGILHQDIDIYTELIE